MVFSGLIDTFENDSDSSGRMYAVHIVHDGHTVDCFNTP